MGLSHSDPDRIILELHFMWSNKKDDMILRGMAEEMTKWLDDCRTQWLKETGQDRYMPYFMNDAAADQEVAKSYKDYEKLKALQQQIDPNGMFRTRLGGFKY